MADIVLEKLAEAQKAPTDDYVLWARIEQRQGHHDLPIQTVRLPQSMTAEAIESRLMGHAKTTLSELGYEPSVIENASFSLERLPSTTEIEFVLEDERAKGHELVLVDLIFWEACRLRLHLNPVTSEFGNDQEMDFKGLKIRRSAVD